MATLLGVAQMTAIGNRAANLKVDDGDGDDIITVRFAQISLRRQHHLV